jgi:hypothetical protein
MKSNRLPAFLLVFTSSLALALTRRPRRKPCSITLPTTAPTVTRRIRHSSSMLQETYTALAHRWHAYRRRWQSVFDLKLRDGF